MCFRLTVVPQLVKRLKGSFALLDFKFGIGDQEVRLTDVHCFLFKQALHLPLVECVRFVSKASSLSYHSKFNHVHDL